MERFGDTASDTLRPKIDNLEPTPPLDSTGKYRIMDEDACGDVPDRVTFSIVGTLVAALVGLVVLLVKGCGR